MVAPEQSSFPGGNCDVMLIADERLYDPVMDIPVLAFRSLRIEIFPGTNVPWPNRQLTFNNNIEIIATVLKNGYTLFCVSTE
jgi:hypothetical protein